MLGVKIKKIKSLKLEKKPFYLNLEKDLIGFLENYTIVLLKLSTLEKLFTFEESLGLIENYSLNDVNYIRNENFIQRAFIINLYDFKIDYLNYNENYEYSPDLYFYDSKNRKIGLEIGYFDVTVVNLDSKTVIKKIDLTKIYEVEITGNEVFPFGNQYFLSEDKKYLILLYIKANYEVNIVLVDLENGEVNNNFEPILGCSPSNIEMSPDNKKIIVGIFEDEIAEDYEYSNQNPALTIDRFCIVFDVESGKTIYDLKRKLGIDMFKSYYSSKAHFNSNGKLLILITNSNTIYFCDSKSGRLLEEFNSNRKEYLLDCSRNYLGLYKKNPEELYDLDIYEYTYD